MTLLQSTLTGPARPHQPFVLLQSSAVQSCVPIIRYLLKQAASKTTETTLLFCLSYPPSALVESREGQSANVHIHDWTEEIPGYRDSLLDVREEIVKRVRSAPADTLNVIIDSLDTLCSDIGSLAQTERFASELLSLLRSRGDSSRLVLHALGPSPLIRILAQTRLSKSLVHLTAHPTSVVKYLATSYLILPPPLSSPEKFWRVFLPVVERQYESEKLIFGPEGAGSGGSEFVVEVLVRGSDGSGKRREVERVLEGWSSTGSKGAPCQLSMLGDLKSLMAHKTVSESAPDPTRDVSFNLNLTPEQQQSRARVPLPYAHEGNTAEQKASAPQQAAILYDPDSADDIDDDDPDEDLDI